MFSVVAARPASLFFVLALVLAGVVSVSCGGNVVSLGDDALPDGGGGDGAALEGGTRSTLGNAGPTPSLPLAACSGGAGAPVTLTDDASAKDAVSAIWLLCGSVSPFGTTDEVGIELLETGAWFKLYNQDGVLVRGDADGELGTFTVGGVTSGQSSFTLDLVVTGSIAIDDTTIVTTNPQQMTVGPATYAFYQDF